MAISAVMRATLQTLRSELGLTDGNSGVTFNAQPPFWSSHPLFLAIYLAAWNPGPSPDGHEFLDEEYAIRLALTYRTSAIPRDRWGEETWLNQSESMEVRARAILDAMHYRRYDIVRLANGYVGKDVIPEPLKWRRTPMVASPMPAEWFHGEPEARLRKSSAFSFDKSSLALEHHGLLMEMEFAGSRRLAESPFLDHQISVSFLATALTQPGLTGRYRGRPRAIEITVDGTTYPATFNADDADVPGGKTWSIAAGVIAPLSIGQHSVAAVAKYPNNRVATDGSVNEITIIDPSDDWLWSTGEKHLWSDDSQAQWVP